MGTNNNGTVFDTTTEEWVAADCSTAQSGVDHD